MPVVPARVSHCQHVVGDATERVGWDLRDVGMINKFPAEDDSEHRLKELMWEINSNTEICLHRLEWEGRGGGVTWRCDGLDKTIFAYSFVGVRGAKGSHTHTHHILPFEGGNRRATPWHHFKVLFNVIVED